MKTFTERLLALTGAKDADAVAQVLRTAMCYGRRVNARCCPVAVFLTAADDVKVVRAGPSALVITSNENEQWRSLPTPAIRDFITDFDNGRYPDLDLEEGVPA